MITLYRAPVIQIIYVATFVYIYMYKNKTAFEINKLYLYAKRVNFRYGEAYHTSSQLVITVIFVPPTQWYCQIKDII